MVLELVCGLVFDNVVDFGVGACVSSYMIFCIEFGVGNLY